MRVVVRLIGVMWIFGAEAFATELAVDGSPRVEPVFTHIVRDAPPPTARNFIRLATWNIEWFPAGQRVRRDPRTAKKFVQNQVKAVAEMIDEMDPDLLFTQETRNLGALVVLNKSVQRPLGWLASAWFGDENDERLLYDEVVQQVGLMSRLPWREAWELDFYPMTGIHRPTRGWLVASFEIKGLTFTVFNGHLKSNFGASDPKDRQRNYAKRLAAIEEIVRELNRLKLDPARDRIVVLGDFNTDPFAEAFADEKTIPRLQSLGFRHVFGNLPLEQRITLPQREGEPFPDGTFDLIFLSQAWGDPIPQAQILMKGASKRKDVFAGDEPGLASDHYPVWIDLPLSP